jgi:hypothetical protein
VLWSTSALGLTVFRGSVAGLCAPLPTLRLVLADVGARLGVDAGRYSFHRSGLSPPAPCRFNRRTHNAELAAFGDWGYSTNSRVRGISLIDRAVDMETNIHIEKSGNLEAWLRKQPPEVAAVIAVRLGLRVLPFVVDEPTEGRFSAQQRRQIISAFRYAAIGRLATKHPSRALDVVATAINSVAPSRMLTAGAAVGEASSSASALLRVALGGASAHAPATCAVYAARLASQLEADAFWKSISADIAWIDANGDPFDLLDRPMWLDSNPPDASPEPYLSRWHLMRTALDYEDESWKVWTGWYQDRLGGALSEPDEIEYFRLTLVPNAAIKANDTSDEGQRQWQQEINTNLTLLRNDARKANRIVAKYITDSNSA